jgi:hypothetical protein
MHVVAGLGVGAFADRGVFVLQAGGSGGHGALLGNLGKVENRAV